MFENFKQVTEYLLTGKMISHRINGLVYKINQDGNLISTVRKTLEESPALTVWLLDEYATGCLSLPVHLEKYVAPKKKIKVAVYRYQKENSAGWFRTSRYFETEADFRGSILGRSITNVVRLTDTEIEVDEEIEDDDDAFILPPKTSYKKKTLSSFPDED